jgi:hypothetical protein
MANLLTDEAKKDLRRDLFERKLVVFGLISGVLLVIPVITLSAFWLNLYIREVGLNKVTNSASVGVGDSKTQAGDKILLKESIANAKVLESLWTENLFSELVSKIFFNKPAGINISGFVSERGGINQPTKVSIVGLAKSRGAIVNYVNSLRDEKFFSQVDLPVESLINEEGGQFVINLEK